MKRDPFSPVVVSVRDDPTDVGVLVPSSPTRGAIFWHTGEADDAERPTVRTCWTALVAGKRLRVCIIRGADVDVWMAKHNAAGTS
jgi:hypothetical protein